MTKNGLTPNSAGANFKHAQKLDELFLARYQKLNSAQKKAVDTIDGPLLVVAGPGSGKTEILSMRVAQILRQTQAMPSNILCLTFTDSASQNMRERLSRLIGDRAYQVSIHTFHNFCTDIIRRHGEFFYHGATFSPADPVTQIAILENLFNQLEYDNPLRSYHPDEGFIFLRPTLQAIAHIKKAGLRPDELKRILEENELAFKSLHDELIPVLDKKLGKDSLSEIRATLERFTTVAAKRQKDIHAQGAHGKAEVSDNTDVKKIDSSRIVFPTIEEAIALSLTEAIHKAEQEEKNEALSNWKKKWLTKDDSGKRIFKDELNLAKMQSLAHIYELYRQEMFNRGYFDFDDMILDVISALEKEPRLRYELQEQFQYMLVDEFQDTNNAQMRILSLLTSAPEHGGRPNIMVVGDDDQAIYKFQGAELSNILDFRQRFIDVELVSMTENYRSTQSILDIAMHIIRKGEKRLENLIPDLSKQLISRGQLEADNIEYHTFETSLHEYKFIAQKIKTLIDAGQSADDIAVIARKHTNLEQLVPYLRQEGVPIKYEREQSVFAEPHISQIITIARYIASVIDASEHVQVRDDLLPQILSFPFWQIPRIDIWNISLKAKKEGKTWLEVMQECANTKIRQIAEFLIELGVVAKSTPLELMLDKIVGAHIAVYADDQDDDILQEEVLQKGAIDKNDPSAEQTFTSPFRSFYFSKEKFSHARAEYLAFLSSLRVFINALRSFNGFEDIGPQGYRTLLLSDLVRFVEIYEKNSLTLNDESPFVTARNAVALMSAHKSKGLEYKSVFVISCQDDVWASRGGGVKISFPINLQIEPAGEHEDDQLRLFYVALTRAKEQLFMTSHEVRDNGKPASQLRFLVGAIDPIRESEATEIHELLEVASVNYRLAPFIDTEEALLRSILEEYKLSVTHLNNFINLPKGGPNLFFEQNLLRFPQSKSPSGAYGSAIHGALECYLHELKERGIAPSHEKILETFEKFLKREKLHPREFALFLKRGKDALGAFLNAKAGQFSKDDIAEMDFGREHICIKDEEITDPNNHNLPLEAFITGKIDKVSGMHGDAIADKLCVHDYKTGRAFESFEDPKSAEAVKAYLYRNQLLFYKILIEESAVAQQHIFKKAGGGKVNCGVIDFVEPIGNAKKILSVETDLEDEEVIRLKRLIIAVYSRIKNLNFDVPAEFALDNFNSEIEAIRVFEDYLINCSMSALKVG